jgi:hypothetical protein
MMESMVQKININVKEPEEIHFNDLLSVLSESLSHSSSQPNEEDARNKDLG